MHIANVFIDTSALCIGVGSNRKVKGQVLCNSARAKFIVPRYDIGTTNEIADSCHVTS